MHYTVKLAVFVNEVTEFSATENDIINALHDLYPGALTIFNSIKAGIDAEGVISTARNTMELAMSLCEACQTAAGDNFARFELLITLPEECCFVSDGKIVQPVHKASLEMV